MALQLGVTSGTKGSGAASFDQDLNITGFPQPGAAVYLYSRNNTGFDNPMAISGLSIGFADGTNEYNNVVKGRNNRSTTNTNRRQMVDKCIAITTPIGNGGVDAEADFKQWNSTGSTITWTTNDGVERTIGAIYFAQSNSDYSLIADCGTFTTDSTENNTINITDLGDSADIVIVASIQRGEDDTGVAGMIQSIGVYVKGQGQASINIFNNDAVGTTDVQAILDTAVAARTLTGSGTGGGAQILDHASGFSVKTLGGAGGLKCGYLAINVGQDFDAWLGEFDVPTVAGTDTKTGIGFLPKYLLTLITQVPDIDTLYTDESAGTYGVGAASSTTASDQYAAGSGSLDNSGTSDENGYQANGIWTGIDPSDEGYQKGVLGAVRDNEFDVDWTGGTIDAIGTSIALVIGTSYVNLSASFDAQGTLDANINKLTPLSTVEFQGQGSFGGSAVLRAWSDLSAAFEGQGTFDTGALKAYCDLSAAFDGQGTFDVGTLRAWRNLAASFDGQGIFDAAMNPWIGFSAAFDGQGIFDAILSIQGTVDLGPVLFAGQGVFNATMNPWIGFSTAFEGQGIFNVNLNRAVPLSALFQGQGIFDASFNRAVPLSALFQGQGIFDASINRAVPLGNTVFQGQGSLDAAISAAISLSAAFQGQGIFNPTLSAILRFFVEFTGLGSFDVGDVTGVAEVPASQYERIQRELITQAQAGTFYRLQYNSGSKQVDVLEDTTVPATTIAREKASNFDLPLRYRQSFRYERKDWIWELILEFHDPVCVEFFEEAIAANPIILPKTATMSQVIMEFTDTEVFHPPQQQPRKGTRAVLNFIARKSPV